MIELSHRPYHPPRKDMIPEQVFAELWEKQMNGEADDDGDLPFDYILRSIPASQKLATLAASFVTWLGTNVGNSLIYAAERTNAERVGGLGMWRRQAYLAAWAIENHRWPGMRNGWRMIEMLAHHGDWNDNVRYLPPKVDADAYELIENLMVWLADGEGQQFLRKCEGTILMRQRQITERELKIMMGAQDVG